ncbi:phosphatidylglycerophosphatase A [bacterium]|nr:phosphatidylglycerophosphatase A [bacterium]
MPEAENSRKKTLAVFVSTMGFTGFFPIMPGTVGTIWGLLMWWGTCRTSQPLLLQTVLAIVFFLLGLVFCGKAEKDLGRHDPGSVIIDETAAAFLTFLGVPFGLWTALIGLFLNRFFDILKPWPINKLQDLPGAWGIMLDDTAAGIASRLVLALLLYFFPVIGK